MDYKARIVVDVDLTVCKTDELWWQWLNNKYGTNFDFPNPDDWGGELNYNLGHYLSSLPDPYKGFDPIAFFRNEGIYDFAHAIEGSREALSDLADDGYSIVFASHCKGNHHKSKYYWLERNFPFIKNSSRHGFVATKEKQFIQADVVIDDRNSFLNKFIKYGVPSEVNLFTNLILFNTPYEQSEELEDYNYVFKYSSWEDISFFIKECM